MISDMSEKRRLKEFEQCSEGMKACNDGQYEVAKDLWEKLSNEGNIVASIDLARLHARSLVSAPDFDLAKKLFEEAGAQGMSEGFDELGLMHEFGTGTAVNFKEAFKFYHLSAKENVISGMFNTGRCCLQGIGVKN